MAKMSMMLGLFEDIQQAIGVFLFNLIGRIMLNILDWLQGIFRALAGLEGMKINGQLVNASDSEAKFDIVYWLISTDLIVDIFWSVMLFSVVLLIITTVMSLVRNQYQEKQKPVWDIISKSFKGLLNFLIVPAFAVVGLMFSNVILQAVDAGTSFGNANKMSVTLFTSSAYDANRIRREEDLLQKKRVFNEICVETNFETYENVMQYYQNINNLGEEDYDTLATMLDNAFTGGYLMTSNGKPVLGDGWYSGKIMKIYKLWDVNYLVLIVGGGILLGMFFKMCWGMVSRMFKCVFDFILIPVVNAMIPFDDGKALGSWKGDFVKNVTMAYATVGAINLYFSILPMVSDIGFANGGVQSTGLFGWIFNLMIQIVGLFTANSVIKTVNGWFGTGDVLGEGESAYKTFQGGVKSIRSLGGMRDKVKSVAKKGRDFTKKALNMHGAYLGGREAAGKAEKNKFWGGIASAFGTTEAGKAFQEMSFTKNINAGKDTGKKYYNERRELEGTHGDWFHVGTDNADRRKAQLMFESTKTKYTGRYQSLQNNLDKAKAGGDNEEIAEAQKRLNEAKAQDPELQQFIKGGGEITIYDEEGNALETGKASDIQAELAYQKSSLEKSQTKQSTLESTAESLSSSESGRMQAVRLIGKETLSGAQKVNLEKKLKEYIIGKNEDFITTEGVTAEMIDAASSARNNYQTTVSKAKDSIKTLINNLGKVEYTIGGVTKTVDKSNVGSLTGPQAVEILKRVPNLMEQVRQSGLKIKQTEDDIKLQADRINAALSTTSDKLHTDATASQLDSYNKGAKS